MTGRDPKRVFATRPSDPDTWAGTPEPTASKNSTKDDLFTARPTIDVTPERRGRTKVAAFRRGITVAKMLRDLLSREFPHVGGTA